MTRNTRDDPDPTGTDGGSLADAGDQPSPSDGRPESAADTPETDPDSTATAGVLPGHTPVTKHKPPEQETFDWRGWLLVGAVVLSFLVVPAVVLFLPQLHGVLSSAGLSLTQTYLVFPMIPALLLGGIAVWAAVRSRTAE